MRSSWEFHRYVSKDAPVDRRHATAMHKVAIEKTGPDKYKKTPLTMWFLGRDAEVVENKIEAFWIEEEKKAARIKAGRLKAAKTRASKKISQAPCHPE